MADPDVTLKEIRRLTARFRDGRICWDDASRLGELVEQLHRAATAGLLPKQWQDVPADDPKTNAA